jgi:hypothetical protein
MLRMRIPKNWNQIMVITSTSIYAVVDWKCDGEEPEQTS